MAVCNFNPQFNEIGQTFVQHYSMCKVADVITQSLGPNDLYKPESEKRCNGFIF